MLLCAHSVLEGGCDEAGAPGEAGADEEAGEKKAQLVGDWVRWGGGGCDCAGGVGGLCGGKRGGYNG